MKSLSQGATPLRSIRVPDEQWEDFKAACDHAMTTPSTVLREFIDMYTSLEPGPDHVISVGAYPAPGFRH